jgi:hypothetical protein
MPTSSAIKYQVVHTTPTNMYHWTTARLPSAPRLLALRYGIPGRSNEITIFLTEHILASACLI